MKRSVLGVVAGVLAFGCGRTSMDRISEAEFIGVRGFENIEGRARLMEAPPGVKILVWLDNAPPGPKGVHVHERGDCSNPLSESMGKHFSPHGENHGLPGAATHHPGDLGNIKVRDDGKGYLELTTEMGNLTPGDAMSFANRAIIVHQGEDKGTGAAGDAGKPLACAVIRDG